MLMCVTKFENYIDRANKARTKVDLFNIYQDTVKQHGLDRVLLCLATDHRDIGETAGMKFMHNYPEHWMDHYFKNELDKIDPVIVYGFNTNETFTWDEVFRRMKLSRLQKKCLNEGVESGLNHGICTPLRGPSNAIGGLSLASTEKKDSFDGKKDLIMAYSNHFYTAYRRLATNENNLENKEIKNHALTVIERDILSYMAKGYTRDQMSERLKMNIHTLDYHYRNILKKLDASSNIQAVVKGITYNLIEL